MSKKEAALQELEQRIARVDEQTTALATIPDSDDEGMDGLGNAERLPQIKVCQNNSPEKDSDSKYYIKGLKEGDLFLTRLRLIVPSPIQLVFAHVEKYAVRKDTEGKVLETAAFEDPRGRFGKDGSKPTIDRTYDFYVVLPSLGMGAVLRMAKTKVPVAEELELQFKLLKGISLGLYELSIFKTANTQGQKFYNFRLATVGRLKDINGGQTLYAQAKALTAQVKAGLAVADDEGGGEVVDGTEIPF